MDLETLVAGVAIGVLIANFIGFIGNRMYECLLMCAEDKAGLLPLAIGGVGWLATIVGGMYVYKLFHSP
jgi:hypothetical protein